MTDTKQSELMGDVWGGLTAAIVALPLALAFGVAAFAPLGPEHASTGALVGYWVQSLPVSLQPSLVAHHHR